MQSYLAVLCFLFLSEEKTEQLLDCKQEFEQMEAELKRLQQEVWVLYIYCLKKSGQKEVAVTRTPPPPFFLFFFFSLGSMFSCTLNTVFCNLFLYLVRYAEKIVRLVFLFYFFVLFPHSSSLPPPYPMNVHVLNISQK